MQTDTCRGDSVCEDKHAGSGSSSINYRYTCIVVEEFRHRHRGKQAARQADRQTSRQTENKTCRHTSTLEYTNAHVYSNILNDV